MLLAKDKFQKQGVDVKYREHKTPLKKLIAWSFYIQLWNEIFYEQLLIAIKKFSEQKDCKYLAHLHELICSEKKENFFSDFTLAI